MRSGRESLDARPLGVTWRRSLIGATVLMLLAIGVSPSPVAGATAVPVLWTAGGLSAGTDSAGQAARMTVDAAGNVAVVSGPADGRFLAVTSYTSSGALRWERTVSPSSGTFAGDWVVAAPNGDFLAVGHTTTSTGSPIAITMVSYTSDGTLRWRVDLARTRPAVARLVVDAAGNAYLAFNSVGDGQDIQVHKYSPAGVLLWSRAISTGTFANDIATSLALSPDGTDIVVTGNILGGATWITASFDAATGVRRWLVTAPEGIAARDVAVDTNRVYVTGEGNAGITGFLTVVAYDRATGARLWRRDMKPADGTSAAGLRMVLAPDGGVVVTGQAARGFLDWYTVALETTGAVRWEAVRDGGLNTDEIPRGVVVLTDGTTVVTGPGGPNLPGGFIQGVTAGYGPDGTLLWEAFSRLATVWVTALPSGDVCATGGYDALITCWRVPAVVSTPPTDRILLSSTTAGTAGSVSFADEDIISLDPATGAWQMYFDGSDVGLAAVDIDAAEALADGRILLSTNTGVTLAGRLYDDSDVIEFTPTSTGSTTAGSFDLYLAGSTVGLTTSGENVDAIAVTPTGELLLSTASRLTGGGLVAPDEDLVEVAGTTLSRYLDGSALGLTAATEDTWGASITTDNRIDFSVQGGFSLTSGLVGGPASIGQCSPASAPPVTACSASTLVAPQALAPFASEVVDAVSV